MVLYGNLTKDKYKKMNCFKMVGGKVQALPAPEKILEPQIYACAHFLCLSDNAKQEQEDKTFQG